ncbi:MAG: translation initiation factor IF-2 N-terminal domain-containing protein, partial [Thiomonas delicata]
MAQTTVAQLATELHIPAAQLLEQLAAASVHKQTPDDPISEADKARLLDHLRVAHGVAGAERKKITLTRKQTTEIKQADSTGKALTIQVEVRKKRVFVKRDEAPPAEVAAPVAHEPVVDEAELRRREEEAKHQSELLARQAEEISKRQREEEEAARARAAEQERIEQERRLEAEAKAKAAQQIQQASEQTSEQVAEASRKAAEMEAEQQAASQAKADAKRASDAAVTASRAAELASVEKRRKAAEKEAAAIRDMLSRPRTVLHAPKPEVAKPAPEAAAKPGATIKGTIHKPAAGPAKPASATAGAGAADAKAKKQVKSEQLSSSWADEAAKRRAIKTRGDTSGGTAAWRGAKGGSRRDSREKEQPRFVAPVEPQVREVHVPETITVGDLAHKMAVKASEVIKVLMKLGQMVTINQVLDQETAMIIVQEMGHQAIAARLDDPETFLEEEGQAHHEAE